MPWAKDLTRAGGGCGDDNPSNPVCNITLLSLACDEYPGCNAFNTNGFLFACPLGRCDCDSSADYCMRGLDIYSLDPSVNFGSTNADTYVVRGHPVPDDLLNQTKTGRLLWGSPEAAECYMPEVGNGYIGSTISWGAVYISGLTNGHCGNVEKARIPSPISFSLSSSSSSTVITIGGALDTINGMYRRRFNATSDKLNVPVSVEERIYAHRTRKNVLVVEFESLSLLTTGDELTLNFDSLFAPSGGGRTPSSGHVPGDGCAGGLTHDFLFSPLNSSLQRATVFEATTTSPGDRGEFWNLTLVVELSNATFSLVFNEGSSTMTYIAVIASSLDSLALGGNGSMESVRSIAQDEYISASASVDAGTLFEEHVSAWAVLNARGVDIEPRESSINDESSLARGLDVAQHVSSSFYYLASSIRTDWNEGISPGGISSASYSGAVFMDQDIWMTPPLLLISPELAASLLQFRFDSIATEEDISKIWGFNGTMVAWTAGYEGRLFGCCDGKGGYEDCLEQHVTGAVAWTAWQYYSATGNLTWLQTIGFPILAGAADFHVSRVTSLGNGNYSMKFVLPIDEWSVGAGCGSENPGVDDDAWQNAVTRVSLLRAADAAIIVNDTSGRSQLWREVGQGVFPLWNDTMGHHNQFTSPTCPGGWGGSHYSARNTVCPEDVNLMASYPLGDAMEIPIDVAEKDALLFTPLTCRENAGMTTTMHTVMWLYLSEQQSDRVNGSYVTAAQAEFNRSMHAACYGPFNVRNEVDKHNDVLGAHYDNSKFLTGDGGFLQAMINGYGGLRILNEATLKILRPHLPDDVGLLRIRNFTWHGRDMTYTISENSTTGNVNAELVLIAGGDLTVEMMVTNSNPTVAPAGDPVTVWAAVDTLHKCGIIDVPDIPARAFVDASTGLTHMIVGSTNFHRMVGNNLYNQTRECIASWNETADPNPSHFAGDEFLDSTIALPNGTVYTLVHTEYPGNVYHNCTGKGYPLCWTVSIGLAVSHDFGSTWMHARPPPDHLVAAVPYGYNQSQLAYGWGDPSNIIFFDDFYYAAIWNRNQVGLQEEGVCIMRVSADLIGDPSAWLAWGGATYNISFVSPYTLTPGTEADHICQVTNLPNCPIGGWAYSTYLKKFVATLDCSLQSGSQFYIAYSDDLLNWSTPLPFYNSKDLPHNVSMMVTSMSYPTFIDPSSGDANFNTIGQFPSLFWVSIGHSPYTDGRRLWATPFSFQ